MFHWLSYVPIVHDHDVKQSAGTHTNTQHTCLVKSCLALVHFVSLSWRLMTIKTDLSINKWICINKNHITSGCARVWVSAHYELILVFILDTFRNLFLSFLLLAILSILFNISLGRQRLLIYQHDQLFSNQNVRIAHLYRVKLQYPWFLCSVNWQWNINTNSETILW